VRFVYLLVAVVFLFYYIDIYRFGAITVWQMLIVLAGLSITGWCLFLLLQKLDQRRKLNSVWVKLPLDTILTRIVEWLSAIPALLILLALSSIVKQQNIGTMILIISFLSWPMTARLVRSEVMRRKYMPYLLQEQH